MKSTHWLGLLLLILVLFGLASINQTLLSMALLVGLYLLWGLLGLPTKIDLSVSRVLSQERVTVGAPVEITVILRNNGVRLDNLLVEDVLPSGLTVEAGVTRRLFNLEKGQQVSWKYTVSGKRGFYTLSSIDIVVSDRFGIVDDRRVLSTDGQLFVLPPVIILKGISIRPRKTRVYSGEIPARSGGMGIDFYGVRPYQPGDPSNGINWMASARHPMTLFSNEFEQERVADVGIILDGRERSNRIAAYTSIFEYSVQAAATLASTFLNQGDRVGLLHYGKYLQWTFPGYGKVQRERILRALTGVQPGHSLIFAYLQYLPTRIFPPQSQIVLISPLMPDDPDVLLQIRARGYQVLVISPDPVSFEKAQLPDTPNHQMAARILAVERDLLIQKLIQGGIRIVNWDVRQPFEQVVGRLNRTPLVARSLEFGG
jgi:uncharacterized repeat protein (TIGR01451 family)